MKESRILAMQGYIKNFIYFRSDFEKIPEYSDMIDNLYDSYKGISIEAANILSGVAEHLKKQIENI